MSGEEIIGPNDFLHLPIPSHVASKVPSHAAMLPRVARDTSASLRLHPSEKALSTRPTQGARLEGMHRGRG